MTNTQSLKVFTTKANQLITSKVILSDMAISAVLKCVASNKLLVDCAMQSLSEYSYPSEFARAKTILTSPDGVNQYRLKTPPTPIRIFAFVMCLLTEFDSGRRNLTDFLYQYYSNPNVDTSYQLFAEQFLRPFKRAGENILRSIDPSSFNKEQEQTANRYFSAERIYINSYVLEQLSDENESIIIKLQNDTYHSAQDKIDCTEIAKAFQMALYSKNPRLIKLLWVALNYATVNTKSTDTHLRKMKQLLVDNNII
ncbi:MAG: hypothetical protein PHW00_04440 [Clostridia bacterium]|nr:hypothetical protein [Clostridia bacterium]